MSICCLVRFGFSLFLCSCLLLFRPGWLCDFCKEEPFCDEMPQHVSPLASFGWEVCCDLQSMSQRALGSAVHCDDARRHMLLNIIVGIVDDHIGCGAVLAHVTLVKYHAEFEFLVAGTGSSGVDMRPSEELMSFSCPTRVPDHSRGW